MPRQGNEINYNIPAIMAPMMQGRHKVKVLYGGRESGKSWMWALYVVIKSLQEKCTIWCTKEIEGTIVDSSLKAIKQTIERLQIGHLFTDGKYGITCKETGSDFIFYGLREQDPEKAKSREQVKYVWVGEADYLTEDTWDVLYPTIKRNEGFEILLDFNPQHNDDFVFAKLMPGLAVDDTLSIKVNWYDNPFITEESKQDIVKMHRENPTKYNYIYGGNPNTIGWFFSEFGEHNEETPFVIPLQDDNRRLIGALDHGIAHDTSFSLAWLPTGNQIHVVFSYDKNGGTTESHAEAICEQIESCAHSQYMYPNEVFYDYAMDTKHKINEQVYLSDLDVYKEVFSRHPACKGITWTPANKRKIDGCNMMHKVFEIGQGVPVLRLFKGMNDKTVKSIKTVETDDVNNEMYAKQDGDDGADKMRYLIMGAMVRMQELNRVNKPKESARAALANFNRQFATADAGVY